MTDPSPARPAAQDSIAAVRAYHLATKHHTHGYAPGPGFLDWDSQPDPFRRFAGAPRVALPLRPAWDGPAYDALFSTELSHQPPAIPWSPESLGWVLELALGLSAWKADGPDRWSMRNTPSSGNLHPTEGYLLLWRREVDGLTPGLYHYTAFDHALERRARLPDAMADALTFQAPGTVGAVGLSSVIWREEWKYGARAFRYCQHDVGHALGALRFAAGAAGWQLRLDGVPDDATLSALLGLDRAGDFAGAEPEHPDLLALLADGPLPDEMPTIDWAAAADALTGWTGQANRLSAERVAWPEIVRLLPHVRKDTGMRPETGHAPPVVSDPLLVTPCPAASLIRGRRSAQRMDGKTAMARGAFERLLDRTLPRLGRAPFDAFPLSPALNLLLFVHGVTGLTPGLYLLERCPERRADFRAACTAPDLAWEPVAGAGSPLIFLTPMADQRRATSKLCCHQGIAGRGACSLGMIGALGPVLEAEGAWAYRRLHWEAGLIGQVLYLEAEAAALRGTGIGCFFDDAVHALLGLETGADAPWQTLYHFTVGGALEDRRIATEPAYGHLEGR